MRQLIVRFLNVAVIAAVLIGYNTVLDKRDKEDQIARLSAELETTQLQKENLQAAAAASNTADKAASEAAEAEGQYVDGTYDGEADGFGGTIAVEVTVEGGQITDLAITSADGEDSAYLSNAEAIIPKIIEAQSADVDTISGATFSSTGIRNAAQIYPHYRQRRENRSFPACVPESSFYISCFFRQYLPLHLTE